MPLNPKPHVMTKTPLISEVRAVLEAVTVNLSGFGICAEALGLGVYGLFRA